jgi:hypothetical protein
MVLMALPNQAAIHIKERRTKSTGMQVEEHLNVDRQFRAEIWRKTSAI